jgi:hypothetical protein
MQASQSKALPAENSNCIALGLHKTILALALNFSPTLRPRPAEKRYGNGRRLDSRYRAASQSAAGLRGRYTQGGARRLACPGLHIGHPDGVFDLRLCRQIRVFGRWFRMSRDRIDPTVNRETNSAGWRSLILQASAFPGA